MNSRYTDYGGYNVWANKRLINLMMDQNKAIIYQKVEGSFPSIRSVVEHLWLVEVGWLSRLRGLGWEVSIVNEFEGTHEELFDAWQKTSKEFQDFIIQVNLEAEVELEKNERSYLIPAREIIQTVCNHGSYHRGQLVFMLRQLGVNEIPQTDYIEWVRQLQDKMY